ncbi:hypothetical protein [Thalassovita sp.]|uniref:hypothetical protein n=1 Tax=Thalassovita sp. TaxID=1979401 RepID=UPI003B5CADA5
MSSKIPLNEFAAAVDRPESLIRMLAKAWEIPLDGGTVPLPSAVRLVRLFESRHNTGMDEAEQCRKSLDRAKDRELELHIAIDILKRERASLEARLEENRRHLDRAEARADRLEGKLHEMSQSLAYLVDQRDRIVARGVMRSQVHEQFQDGRPVLVLSRPVA